MKNYSYLGLLLLSWLMSIGTTHAVAPINDNFASATDLGSAISAIGNSSVDDATPEIGEPFLRFDDQFMLDYFGNTVWWKWTCPTGSDRLVNINTAGSTEDGFDEETLDIVTRPLGTILMVFTGTDLASLTPLVESHRAVASVTSEVSFIATPGTTYYIRVEPADSQTFNSDVKLNLTSIGTPTTADSHVAWGKARMNYAGEWTTTSDEPQIPSLTSTALDQAGAHFQSAVTLSKNHPEANVWLAIVSLLKLEKEPAFAALRAELGIIDDSADPNYPNYTFEEDLNGNEKFSPTANSAQAIFFGRNTICPRVLAASSMLEKATSTTFLATIPDHLMQTDSFYMDYGDVLMLRGGLKVLMALMDMLESYQFAANLQELRELNNVNMLDAQHAADLLGDFLKFTSTNKRASLKSNLQAAITLYNQASTHIRTKRPLLRDEHHLFPLRGDPEGELDMRNQLGRINQSLNGTAIIEDGWSINLSKMLSGTLSLRDLTPNFKGNKIIKGSVSRPDMGGILPGSTTTKIENFLRDEEALFEDLIQFGTGVTPGQETFGAVNEPGGMFLPGTSYSISATPALGYVFAGWKFGDQTVSPLSPYIFPVVREYTLLAQFAEDNHDDDQDGLSNYSEVQLGTNRSSPDSDNDGWPDGLDASPLTADPRTFIVSQNLGTVSLNLPVGTITAVKNLPVGVTFDAKNQRLLGRPNFLGATVLTPKTFTIVATVKPLTGATYNLNLTFTVEPLPQKFYGVFNGLADRGAINKDFGGSLNITVTNSGGVTGKLIMGGVTYAFPANLRLETMPAPSNQAVCLLPALKPVKTEPAVYVSLAFNADTGRVTGTASPVQTPNDPSEIDLIAEQQVAPALNMAGTYNSLLTPGNHVSDLAYPQGSGYSIVKLSNKGVITWAGKLADGTTLTGGSTIGSAGEAPLHQMLYNNRGSIQGWSQIAAGRQTNSAPLTWLKKDILTATRSYKNGFPTVLDVNLNGSFYDPKSTLFNVLGLTPGVVNTVAVFTQANLGSPVSQTFQIIAPSVVKVPTTTGSNPTKVTLSIAASTGLFTGSFTPVTGRKATFSGAIVPHLQVGGGHFLLPESTLTTSPILSGKVEIRLNDN
jgi:hypothetical protein